MNDHAKLVKVALMLELSKTGKTLSDLEESLTNKSDDLVKNAANWFIDPAKFPEILHSMFNMYGASALAPGILAGTGAYTAYKLNQDSTDRQVKKFKEQKQYGDATNEIKEDMAHPLTV